MELDAVEPAFCSAIALVPMAVALAMSERALEPMAMELVLVAEAESPSAVEKKPEALA